MHKKSRKERKRLLIISIVIISLLTLLVGSVYKDWKQILKNRRTENELSKKYEKLLEDETKLNAEITKLEDSEYLMRYAKEKYMLSRDGDIIIKMD
jgi:cell division protein FtsB